MEEGITRARKGLNISSQKELFLPYGKKGNKKQRDLSIYPKCESLTQRSVNPNSILVKMKHRLYY